MAERGQGEKPTATESTVTGADWYGEDVSGQEHTRVRFVDLDMTDARGSGAVFTECTFHRARFNVAQLESTAFLNCTFSGCSFYDARLKDCKLVGSTFDGCTFDVMQVTGGNWSFVGLPGADLRSAAFTRVQMREADLNGARCDGAALRDVDLSGASLRGATLARCDLRGSDLSAVDPRGVELRGAVITIDQAIIVAQALGLDVRLE